MAEKYRLFVQDIGDAGYSGYFDIEASDATEAIMWADHRIRHKLIALPFSRRDLWPDGDGNVKAVALLIGRKA